MQSLVFLILGCCCLVLSAALPADDQSNSTKPSIDNVSLRRLFAAIKNDMHVASILIVCYGITVINANPEWSRRMVTKSFKNDGSLETFFEAINYGSVRAVKEIIGGRNVNDADENGVTALHIAAIKGNEEMADLLIKNGADVNKRTNNGATPLHAAANNGNDKFAKTLINNGADVNSVDKNGVSPLQLAAFEDYKRVIDLLIKNGANVNHQDNGGKSVLHWAAAKASGLVAEQLINAGAESVSVLDDVGKTPLYYATLAGNQAFEEVLLNFLSSGCELSSPNIIAFLISISFSLVVI